MVSSRTAEKLPILESEEIDAKTTALTSKDEPSGLVIDYMKYEPNVPFGIVSAIVSL